MLQGLYTAASGMLALEARQEITANNVANASTPGFKRLEPVQLGFYNVFSEKMRRPFHFNIEAAPAGGVKIVESFADHAAGPVRLTSNPLNVALQGPGFLVVDTPRGARYTRFGDFSVDIEGHLATTGGHKVQTAGGGPIDVRGGNVNIGRDGSVTVDGIPAGRLDIVEFEKPERLTREGDNLYSASEEVQQDARPADRTTLAQSHLELSNVSVVRELSALTMGMRAYEANQRVIAAFDTTMSRLIESVGMPS